MIKFYDILENDKNLHPNIIRNIKRLFIKGDYILGKETFKFEKNFSRFVGAKYGIGVANGTDALILALKVLNLPKNSEVILPAMTYCSTIFSILHANLKPVLVDTEFNSPTIDISAIKKKLQKKLELLCLFIYMALQLI